WPALAERVESRLLSAGLVTAEDAVVWQRAYDPDSVARDTQVKAALKADGITARSHAGHILFEPWTVETKTGGFYRVYTPYWKAVARRPVADLIPAPRHLDAPATWPRSEALSDWHLGRAMQRGAQVLANYACVGEVAAQDRLAAFVSDRLSDYVAARDKPAMPGTSGLSENLALGEISPARCWHAAQSALHAGNPGAEVFLKELVWRDFAYHLMFHTPQILTRNWRPEWDAFPWSTDPKALDLRAWQQGRTGIPFVDAAMREMYVTGRMHNRGRMIVASLLTKHLMTDWRLGLAWFEDCLTDWDPASNAMGWQWAAGSGPDAAPYFRIFNPVSQLDKFDPPHDYPGRWIAEGRSNPAPDALRYFDAVPQAWGLRPDHAYPAPIVDLAQGRTRALDAYANRASAAAP
ncbi:MAG: cryptochrome/photolyase family protein, partial [Paracoccaceae bacterium]